MVLLHGCPDSGALRRHQVPALADAGFRCIVPDLPGFRSSDVPQMTGSSAHVAGPWRYERLDGPGHWIPLDAPAVVNRLLLDFLPV